MSEQLHTAREVATELGIGAAMLRRYASTYEAVSGDQITVHRRDGRLFTGEQLAVLVKARELVMRTNTDVETAMKQALEQPVTGDAVALAQSSALDSATLLQLLTDANKAATKPLLDEMQSLRDEVAALRSEIAEIRVLPQRATPERIDHALEVEMRESRTAPEIPPAAREVINTISGVDPQREEHESWIAEAAVQALITASELPAKPREGGLFVKAAEWLERRLRGK